MMHISHDPSSLPALVAMAIGGAIFGALVVAVRLRSGETGGDTPRSRASVVGIGLQMAAYVAVGLGTVTPSLEPLSVASVAETVIVALLMGSAIWLFVASSRALGANWSLEARVRDEHSLVTNGPFARVRHPIYGAMLLFLLALAIAVGHWRQLAFGAPLFVIGTLLRVSEEERLLLDRFGPAFDDYAARVTRFVPGLF
jgi:protein-S-isoprenylcysteine O-methyltransferase Ste14